MLDKEKLLLEGELNTRIHIQDMNTALLKHAKEFMHRATIHDASKLEKEEYEKFSLAATKFKESGNEYGTEGYNNTKKWLGSAIEHHYENNSHHPEHYTNGLLDMNLFDIIEMLTDWKEASKRRSKTGILDLSLARTQHKISPDILALLKNTADYLEWEYTC